MRLLFALLLGALVALGASPAHAGDPDGTPAKTAHKDYRSAAFNGLAAYAKSQFRKTEGKTRVGRSGPSYDWHIDQRPRFLGLGRVDQIAVRSKNADGGWSEHAFDILRKTDQVGHRMLKEHSVRHYGLAGHPLGHAVKYRAGHGRAPVRSSLRGWFGNAGSRVRGWLHRLRRPRARRR